MPGSENIVLASRAFTLADQQAFAEFSGDFNPIHVDPVIARRTITGQCVVHGIHGVIWALDALVAHLGLRPATVNGKFSNAIFLDEEVQCLYDATAGKMQIRKEATVLSEMLLKFDSAIDSSEVELTRAPRLAAPLNREIRDLIGLPPQPYFYRGDPGLASTLFPHVVAAYGAPACCEMAAISELVGMQAPGLHSLFLSARIHFQRTGAKPGFAIEYLHERYGVVRMALTLASLSCRIDALFRQKPVVGLALKDLQAAVDETEFRTVRALIIGGSRGLGESTAKLIALGGGEVVITYSSGQDDCLRVAREITDFGRNCSIGQLRVPGDLGVLGALGDFNQVYYFPTPRISKRTVGYDDELRASFHAIYVDGFRQVLNHFSQTAGPVSIFYPSSVAIDSPSPALAEYIDAKIDGERLCAEFDGRGGLSVVVSRIPRTRTDQTMSLIEAKTENPEDVMLPIVREMAGRAAVPPRS